MSDFIVDAARRHSKPCCPDFTKLVCFACEADIRVRLDILARNLAVAGGLCAAFELGETSYVWATGFGELTWRPGCGQPVR